MMSAEEQFHKTVRMIDYILGKFVGINVRVTEERSTRMKFAMIFVATASFDVCAALYLVLKAKGAGLTFDDCDVVPKLIISIMSSVKLLLASVNEVPAGRLLSQLQHKLHQNHNYVQSRDHLRETIDNQLSSVNMIAKLMLYNSTTTLALFMISPLIFMPYYYMMEERLVVYAPMNVSYIWWDTYDLVGWLLTYLHTGAKGLVAIAGFSCELLILSELSLLHSALITLADKVHHTAAPIKQLVMEHQQLLHFSDMLNGVFSVSMLCFFGGSSFLICFIAFIISTVNENLLSFLLLLSLYICLIFMINYFGNKIIDASLEVSSAIYACEWHQRSPQHMRLLHIMMIRSQRPCALQVYKFAAVNIQTFTKVLSSAWSYFALLRTFYTKE